MLFDLISDPLGRRCVPYPSLFRPRARSSLENAPRDDLCIFDAPLSPLSLTQSKPSPIQPTDRHPRPINLSVRHRFVAFLISNFVFEGDRTRGASRQ